MAKRMYGQYCGLARALEIVGERWALLIIRDLLVGPRRFTDLRRGLPRIPSNILTVRLKELEHAGVVRRRVLPRPASAVVYELTEYGRELEGPVLSLARWGAQSLGEPGADDIVTADSMIMALRSTFRPERTSGTRTGYELRLGEVVVHARVEDGTLEAAEGTLDGADAVIETGPVLRELMAGETGPDELVERGEVRLTGDPALLARFADTFRIPALPVTAAG